jgi:protein-S-isoprenylcysteine O-methyltransferase Ste14
MRIVIFVLRKGIECRRITLGFLNYFQLATVIIVVCAIATKALYSWRVTGVFPIVIGRGKGAWRIIELLSFVALILLVSEVLLRALRSRFDMFPDPINVTLLHSQPARILGVMLILLGLILFLLAFLNFGTSWRIGIDRKTPGSLVTDGVFTLSRNPIYVAFITIFFGIFLINGTWFFLIFALLAVVFIHFQILREEEFLKKQYGRSYDEYCQRAARYLIW